MVKTSKISTFWIIFLAVLVALAIGVAGYTYVTLNSKVSKMQMSIIDDENVYKIGQENIYKQSLYTACDNLQQMDLLLGKVAVSTSTKNQAQMLGQVAVCAQAVEQCLSNLPISVSDNYYACQQFANQVEDYSNYLIGQLADNGKLTLKEQSNLMSLDGVATKLCTALTDYVQGDSGMYVTNGSGIDGSGTLTDTIDGIEQDSLCYNQLCYDGNYSQVEHKAKLQCGKDIGKEQIVNKVHKLFGKAKFVDTIQSGNCTLYDFDLDNGRVVLTQDGNVLLFQSYNKTQQRCNMTQEQAKAVAQNCINWMGYSAVPMWVQQTTDNSIFVYCYPVVDNVVIYPKSVVVEVDCASGKAVGMQAKGYLSYTAQQNYTFGDISQEQALKTVSSSLKMTNTTKALWQKYDKYHMCYQVEGVANGNKYLVFVDSVTGKEVDIVCLDGCTGQMK